MTEVKDSSSLPLLLTITGAVLVVVVGGWFFLGQETNEPESSPAEAALTENAGARQEDAAAAPAPETSAAPVAAQNTTTNVDVELRKARLAADADILVLPATQSALHYYGRVLQADPNHAIAAAELDAILTRVSQDVSELLESEEYDAAYEIASLVAAQQPEHELVIETQRVLDQHTEELVNESIQLAQKGDDNGANEVLATVAVLPGRNPDYLDAVRDSITEIRDVRQAAERDRAQRARLAANEARTAWANQTLAAIEEGNLIAPAGASAMDLLAEENSWDEERATLTSKLLEALLATAASRIEGDQLEDAELLLNAATGLNAEFEGLAELRSSLENTYVELQSNRLVSTKDLTYVSTVPPRYPRRAAERDISGWVVVEFTVTPDGGTQNVAVTDADPERIFDKAAVEAVEQWTFEPVVYRGRTISQRAGARLVFNIE